MKPKMKVITIELSKESLQNEEKKLEEKDQTVYEQCNKFHQTLKVESQDKLDRVRNFITQKNIKLLSQIVQHFIKYYKKDKIEVLSANEQMLRENIDKATRKLSQAMILIEHIKQKLHNKQIELVKRDETITKLKKECQMWQDRIRKSKVLSQLSQNSPILMKSLQFLTQSYQKPQEIEIDFQTGDKRQNKFFKTSYELNSPSLTIKSDIAQNERKKYYTTSTSAFEYSNTRLSKKRHDRRMIRNTLDKIGARSGSKQIKVDNQGELRINRKQIKHKGETCKH